MVSWWGADRAYMGTRSFRHLALMLILPVVLIAGAVLATAEVQRDTALAAASRQVASQQLLTAVLDQETSARGFFQTRKPVFLVPWQQGTTEFGSSLSALRRLIPQNSSLARLLTDQATRANAWHAATDAAITTLRRDGPSQSVAAALRAKTLMDGFRSVHAAFDAALAKQRNQSLSRATTIAVAVAAVLAILLIGLALQVTRRIAGQERARRRDQAELRELLQVSESEQESRSLLIRHIEKMLPGARAAVFNRNNSDDRLEITRSANACDSPLSPENTAQLTPRSCMAVRLSRPYDHHPGDDVLLRCEICGELPATSVCEPLLVGGQVIGSVLVASSRSIDTDHRARMRASVAQAAPILANQRNLMLAETRAASDALTGLPNRRAAVETLHRMAAHAGRSVSPLAAILLDLDHFKALNDRYGHECGDRALALVGRIISATIRASDFAARYGGEEFLILLPDTERDGALLVAENLRSEIEKAELSGIGSVTASLGVAVLPTDAVEPDDLMRKADRALYIAKETGRNRVNAITRALIETP
jgi:diguanylate cyclase (GGDEF)-like protein